MTDRPHIGINLVWLTPGGHGGLEVYVRELVSRLADRRDLRATVFVSREGAGQGWGVPEVVVPVHPEQRVQWIGGEQTLLPAMVARARCDLLHNPANTAPALAPCPQVTTIHDLNYRMVANAFTPARVRVMGALVRLAAARSARILAISHVTAHDLTTELGVPPGKIDVVWQGVNARRGVTPTAAEEVRARFGIGPRRVVLSVCAKRPIKNLVRLIEAHAQLPHPRPALVLVGHPEGFQPNLSAAAHRSGVEDDVRFVDWVEDGDLEGLFGVADVFAFPSLYEGFGLPPLEAMQRGVPVVVSDRGSLAEVVGDAAVVVDPEDTLDIADGIARLLDDEPLRQRTITAGTARAATFSWEQTIEGTVGCYRRALGEAEVGR